MAIFTLRRLSIKIKMFQSKIKFNREELKKMLLWLDEFIEYRGGMGNRIDAFMIKEKLKNKLSNIKHKNPKFWKTQVIKKSSRKPL